jgi:hypothetical protein
MKVVREMFNKTRDEWEFLTDDNYMLVQSFQNSEGTNIWKLYKVEPTEVLDENWEGEEIWSLQRDYTMGPELVLAQYEREQHCKFECELFGDLDVETQGELIRAYQHIEAGDLTGAFQHLIQFATWAVNTYGDAHPSGEVWEKYGPHYGAGSHLHIVYRDGWQLDDTLNEAFYGPLCPNCHRPYGMCICQPPSEPSCERCGHYMSECRCHVEIPF